MRSDFRTAPLSWVALLLLVPGISGVALDWENHPGRAIYGKLCTECHGERGEGVEGLDVDPLVGTRTLESLAGRIERTMPEDHPEKCAGEEAALVAEYIYHAFYSPSAQAKVTEIAPRLSRLTGTQTLNSVTDLIASFRDAHTPPFLEDRGLKGNYTLDDRSRAGNNDFQRQTFERVDPAIRFDYGTGLPSLPEDLETDLTQFRITWSGSIFARDTGIYEFTLRTRNGARLFLNQPNRDQEATIDAWVAPGNDIREESGRVYLLGGRHYQIHVEFFKYREEKALVELLWKAPHGTRELVPEEVLAPNWSHPVFITEINFPADDRSMGFEQGTTVSRVWLDTVTSLALDAATYVQENLDQLARTKADAEDRPEKIRKFALDFTERAFRRPLRPEEWKIHVDTHFERTSSPEDAIRRVVLNSISSPRFLYPSTAFDSPHDPWAKATALSLAIWDSLPDNRLRKAAAEGKLDKPEDVEKEAWRMQWDGRARHKVAGFFHHWLELSRAEELAKDSTLFPEFNSKMMGELHTSLQLFLDEVVWSEESDYRQLLLAEHLYLNPSLGKIYGKEDLKGGFQKVSMPKEGRTGLITHPYLLSAFAYHNNTSPIHRGVFLTRNIVGLPLRPPPEAIEFEDGSFPPDLTMREKVTEITRAGACMACHATINPLGFSLEHYDAIGRWRSEDGGKPVDVGSVLETDHGDRIEIKGPREVAEYAANSPYAHASFVRHLFHHTVKQPLAAYGPGTAEHLETQFRENGFSIRLLLVKMAVAATQPIHPDS